MPSRNQQLQVFAALLVITGLIVVYGCIFTVNERELAVVMEFGKPIRGLSVPGLNFKKPFIQDVRRLPKTKQFWANARGDMLVDLPTKDGKKIEVSVWAIWRITDAQKFLTVLQTTQNAEKQVRQRVRAAIRDTITSFDLSEAVRSTDRELTYSFGLDQLPSSDSEDVESTDLSRVGEQAKIEYGREELLKRIRTRVQNELLSGDEGESKGRLDRGIEVVDVGVDSISFTDSVRRAAFLRLIAFMESVAAGHTNAGMRRKQEILNQTTADAERILGEGLEQSKRMRGEVEAEIIEQYATAIRTTGDFYNFQRTLQVYETALDSDTRLVLTTDSDLFRMLKQVTPSGAEETSLAD